MHIKAVIHPNPTRKHKKPRLNRSRYEKPHRVEIFFHYLKRFRAIGTRFEKGARTFLALIHLASSAIWLQDLLGDA